MKIGFDEGHVGMPAHETPVLRHCKEIKESEQLKFTDFIHIAFASCNSISAFIAQG